MNTETSQNLGPRATEASAFYTPETYFVASTHRYRKYARLIPTPKDTVLEIGASFGDATEALAKHVQHVYALDHSKEMFAALKTRLKDYGNVTPLWHDARDVHELISKLPKIDVLFFDIGGDAPAHAAVYLLHLYIYGFKPRVLVARNIALAGMLGHVKETEFPDKKNYLRYMTIPTRDEVLAHYARENKRSGRRFVERLTHKKS